MPAQVEEKMPDNALAYFQAALLFTSSKGERRIRVHTLALPIVSDLGALFKNSDAQAIAALMAKMTVERALTSKLQEAREALVKMTVDIFKVFRNKFASSQGQGMLLAPGPLRLLPLLVLALLKHVGGIVKKMCWLWSCAVGLLS